MAMLDDVEEKALQLSEADRRKLVQRLDGSSNQETAVLNQDVVSGLISALKTATVPEDADGDARLEHLLKKHVS
ncbi:MAG: hypothetical protein ACI8UO_000178 [Verrucomicrobiales bacterium]|jgi:hypothetical protein